MKDATRRRKRGIIPAPPGRWARICGPRRGSTIVFVVVSLVLMVVLSTAFLQMARVTRVAMSDIDDSNIETVRTAEINRIGKVLVSDLFDNAGNYFTAAPPGANGTEAGDEPYDYPWTNQDLNDPRNRITIQTMNGSTLTAYGGHLDDAWLAATTIDFSTGTPTWRHVTNLDGLFLRLPKIGSGVDEPLELAVDHSDYLHTDTALEVNSGTLQSIDSPNDPLYEPIGGDADGDGIADSIWSWAAIRQIGAVRYVVIRRMVDLSSMLNINTATALTGDGTSYGSLIDMPRGYYPSDVDLTRLVSRSVINSQWAIDIDNLLQHRGLQLPVTMDPLELGLGYNVGTRTFGYTPQKRVAAWFDIGRYYGEASRTVLPGPTTYRRFSVGSDLNDEMELRHRFGLNNDILRTTLENQAPQLLRAEVAMNGSDDDADTVNDETELTYWDVVGPVATPEQFFMQGRTGTQLSSNRYDGQRHFLTTLSGAVPYAANHFDIYTPPPAQSPGSPVLRYDLVNDDSVAAPAVRAGNIQWIVQNIMQIGTPTYLDLGATELSMLSTEYAVAIQDYSDTDDDPTELSFGGANYYGLELMPFLREVYIQVGYDDFDRVDEDGDGDPATGAGTADRWEVHPDSEAMAIEIGNPFDRPIPAASLNGRIAIVVVQNNTDVKSYYLSSVGSLAPRDKLVLYVNPTSPVTEDSMGADLTSDLSLPASAENLDVVAVIGAGGSPGSVFNADGTSVTIELRVDVGGKWETYDRLTHASLALPATHDHPLNFNVDETSKAHGQGSLVRPCSTSIGAPSIHYVSNTGKGIVGGSMRFPDNQPPNNTMPPTYDTSRQKLGADNKGVNGDVSLNNFQIPLANRQFLCLAEMGWILMLGFTDQANGDFPQRFDALRTTSVLPWQRHAFLDFDSAAEVPSGTGIPHAAMILDQFTTLATHVDGVDNDNADGDGYALSGADDEQLVPGLINLNTAPLAVGVSGAPLPESIDDIEALFRRIGLYRDDSTVANRRAMRTA